MPLDSAEPVHVPYGPLPEGGSVLPVVRWGTPVMHRRQADVTAYDDDLRRLVADLAATMYAADGVGLAACQVGVDLRVFVFDCHDSSGQRTLGVVCNPEVTLPEGKDRRLESDDALDERAYGLELPLVLGADDLREDGVDHYCFRGLLHSG